VGRGASHLLGPAPAKVYRVDANAEPRLRVRLVFDEDTLDRLPSKDVRVRAPPRVRLASERH